LSRFIALRIVSSFRMQATRATMGTLPAWVRRSYIDAMTGLKRLAMEAAMYSTARTGARPHFGPRLPRNGGGPKPEGDWATAPVQRCARVGSRGAVAQSSLWTEPGRGSDGAVRRNPRSGAA
jgi:hypothetical protein